MPDGISSSCCTPPSDPSRDRKSTRLNSSHLVISYAVFCLKKKKKPTFSLSSQTLPPNGSSTPHYSDTPLHSRPSSTAPTPHIISTRSSTLPVAFHSRSHC